MFRTEGPPAGELRAYIPEAMGNRALPEPMRLVIRNPTEAQKREIFAQMKFVLKLDAKGRPVIGEDGKPVVEIDMMADAARRKRTIEHCLVSVENFQRRGPGDSWVPVTEKDFPEHAPSELFDEVADEALTGYSLTADAKKKPGKSSGSTRAKTRRSNGIATSAAAEGSASQEAATGRPPQTSASSRG